MASKQEVNIVSEYKITDSLTWQKRTSFEQDVLLMNVLLNLRKYVAIHPGVWMVASLRKQTRLKLEDGESHPDHDNTLRDA